MKTHILAVGFLFTFALAWRAWPQVTEQGASLTLRTKDGHMYLGEPLMPTVSLKNEAFAAIRLLEPRVAFLIGKLAIDVVGPDGRTPPVGIFVPAPPPPKREDYREVGRGENVSWKAPDLASHYRISTPGRYHLVGRYDVEADGKALTLTAEKQTVEIVPLENDLVEAKIRRIMSKQGLKRFIEVAHLRYENRHWLVCALIQKPYKPIVVARVSDLEPGRFDFAIEGQELFHIKAVHVLFEPVDRPGITHRLDLDLWTGEVIKEEIVEGDFLDHLRQLQQQFPN